MRVLVTGSGGYIGSVLAPFLRDSGHEVLGLDAQLYRGCDFGADTDAVPAYERDVRDVSAAELEGLDAVVHLAALSNDPTGDLNPELTTRINLGATLQLARAARTAGVRRFVFASSCAMYGASSDGDVLDEDAPLRPLTPYAESKARAEEGLVALAGPDFAPAFMRNATVYGVSPRLRLDVVLNNLAAFAHTTGSIRLQSDGRAWRPLVHVRDVARAALAILAAPEDDIRGQAINIGTNEQNYLVRALAELLAGITGCAVEVAPGSSADPRSYRVDFSKLGRLLPELRLGTTAEEGGAELIDAFRTHGLTLEELDGDRFVRLRRLRRLLDDGALDPDLRWQTAPPRVRLEPAGLQR